MKLEDLPPELFRRVIVSYVTKVGIDKAWKHREVSSAFAIYITEEVFGGQPIEAYKRNSRTKKLLREGSGLYLEFRAMTLSRAHPVLSPLVLNIRNRISQVQTPGTRDQERALLKQVSSAVAKYCPEVYRQIITKDPKQINSFANAPNEVIGNALCIAITFKNETLVRTLMDDSAASAWQTTIAFGLPIKVAAATGNEYFIKMILDYMEANKTGVTMKERTKLLSKTIVERIGYDLRAITDKRTSRNSQIPLTGVLMKWHLKLLSTPTMRTRCHFFEWCVRTESPEHLDLLFGLKIKICEIQQVHYFPPIYFRCPPNAEITQRIIQKGILKVNETYNANRDRDWEHKIITDVLCHAVSHGEVQAARKVLEAGARADGIKGVGIPLRMAIKEKDEPMVRLLLEFGADPEAGSYPDDSYPLVLTPRKSPIYKLLLDAIMKKMMELGEKYEVPDGCISQHFSAVHRSVQTRLKNLSKYFEEAVMRGGRGPTQRHSS